MKLLNLFPLCFTLMLVVFAPQNVFSQEEETETATETATEGEDGPIAKAGPRVTKLKYYSPTGAAVSNDRNKRLLRLDLLAYSLAYDLGIYFTDEGRLVVGLRNKSTARVGVLWSIPAEYTKVPKKASFSFNAKGVMELFHDDKIVWSSHTSQGSSLLGGNKSNKLLVTKVKGRASVQIVTVGGIPVKTLRE